MVGGFGAGACTRSLLIPILGFFPPGKLSGVQKLPSYWQKKSECDLKDKKALRLVEMLCCSKKRNISDIIQVMRGSFFFLDHPNPLVL